MVITHNYFFRNHVLFIINTYTFTHIIYYTHFLKTILSTPTSVYNYIFIGVLRAIDTKNTLYFFFTYICVNINQSTDYYFNL